MTNARPKTLPWNRRTKTLAASRSSSPTAARSASSGRRSWRVRTGSTPSIRAMGPEGLREPDPVVARHRPGPGDSPDLAGDREPGVVELAGDLVHVVDPHAVAEEPGHYGHRVVDQR